MNGMTTNSLPKSYSQTSITPRLPKPPRVSPLPKNLNTEQPLVVPNSCLCPKLSTHYVDDPLGVSRPSRATAPGSPS